MGGRGARRAALPEPSADVEVHVEGNDRDRDVDVEVVAHTVREVEGADRVEEIRPRAVVDRSALDRQRHRVDPALSSIGPFRNDGTLFRRTERPEER
jgi:hypothetical protein